MSQDARQEKIAKEDIEEENEISEEEPFQKAEEQPSSSLRRLKESFPGKYKPVREAL